MCAHRPLAMQLVSRGFFPSSPVFATHAFSLKLLDFYYHLWFHSADSATAADAALHGFHADLGYVLRNAEVSTLFFPFAALTIVQGDVILEGYRRPLQYAIQWYDVLRSWIDGEVQQAIHEAKQASASVQLEGAPAATLTGLQTPPLTPPSTPSGSRSSTPDAPTLSTLPTPSSSKFRADGARWDAHDGGDASTSPSTQPLSRPSAYLVSRCPACFSEARFGRTVAEYVCFYLCSATLTGLQRT